MRSRIQRVRVLGAAVALAVVATHSDAPAGKVYRHRSRRCASCGVRQYNYQPAAKVTADAVVAAARADQPPNVETEAAGNGAGGTAGAEAPQDVRKAFFADDNSLVVDHVTLSRFGLALYQSGRYVCSGRLSFDGGPDKALEGANVVVRLRAYSGVPQQTGEIDRMRLLWQTQRSFWIARDQSKTISLIPDPPCPPSSLPPGITVLARDTRPSPPSTLIHRHLAETTHLEIVLEHHHDR